MRQLKEPGRRSSSPAAYHGGPPSALRCLACNGSFFAASLPIHQKTCFQRNAFVEMACRKCQAKVRSGLLLVHEDSCSGPATKETEHELCSDHPPAQELSAPDADGRIRCRKCGRGFQQDRIAKHQSICHAASTKTPKTTSAHEDHYPPRRSSISPVVASTRTKPAHKTKESGPSRTAAQRATASEYRMQNITPDFRSPNPSASSLDRCEHRTFDPVHRDAACHDRSQSSWNSSAQGRSAMLSVSNASSTANPLATNRLMTV